MPEQRRDRRYTAWIGAVLFLVAAVVSACDGGAPAGDVGPAAPDAAPAPDAGPGPDAAPPGDARPAGADGGPADAAPDAAPDAALPPLRDPAAAGPWRAGVRTIELTDPARGRTLPVDVWYPVAPMSPTGSGGGAADEGTDNEYVLDTVIGVLGRASSPARRDAAPAPGGPRPLVVFSHGFGGIRFQSFFLTEHLATHGFVVAAPDHVGNRLSDFALLSDDAAVAQSSVDRPLDVAFVRAALLADPAWDLDPARVAVAGHSFGGWTSVEAAARDPGFAAVVALAPGFLHGAVPERAADVGRPLCILGGTADRTTPFEEHQRPAFAAARPPKLLVAFADAGHFDFTLLCDLPAAVPIVGDDGCHAERVDWTVVQAHTSAVAAAFLFRWLDADERHAPFLAVDALAGLGGLEAWAE